MTPLLLFFLVGVVLLAADIFVASFLLAVLGGITMLAGCFVAYQQFGFPAAAGAGLAALILLGATVYFELAILPKTRLGRDMVVRSTVNSTSQPVLAQTEDVVGKTAEALTILAPSGYVLVDGQRYEAFCQSGHSSKGDSVRVVGLDNFRLIVSKI